MGRFITSTKLYHSITTKSSYKIWKGLLIRVIKRLNNAIKYAVHMSVKNSRCTAMVEKQTNTNISLINNWLSTLSIKNFV